MITPLKVPKRYELQKYIRSIPGRAHPKNQVPLTWDTLKRIRRQKRKTCGIDFLNVSDNTKEEFTSANPSKDDIYYKSTPNLISSLNESILKYTSEYFYVFF